MIIDRKCHLHSTLLAPPLVRSKGLARLGGARTLRGSVRGKLCFPYRPTVRRRLDPARRLGPNRTRARRKQWTKDLDWVDPSTHRTTLVAPSQLAHLAAPPPLTPTAPQRPGPDQDHNQSHYMRHRSQPVGGKELLLDLHPLLIHWTL